MEVRLVPEAREELRSLLPAERAAMVGAMNKLEAGGVTLAAPHTSQVKGSILRELRPRRIEAEEDAT
jgi:phage-related protein